MPGRLFAGKRPTDIGVRQDRLKACPKTPNCVCSQADDDKHHIAPLVLPSVQGAALIERIAEILSSWERTEIVVCHENYLYAECRSKMMGFVDDLECFWSEKDQVCHVRSASRLGKSDFGKNQKRVEQLRSDLKAD
ncbi:DUF1499 domain-containing protein [Halomonas sp. PR-M31]|uniref:DUF1499 domain-containing protein n=1 Tax=Halomonas sp. PR-M31 TaxID=1471202 RepID=UPI0006505933|nr:DUF1499 domain-containing protein [Halomonas sp. PR-M31]